MDGSDDPIVTPLAVGAMVGGTVLGARSQLQEGREIEALSRERAAIDEANARAVERQTREAVLLEQERGRKFLKTQKAQFAAANVRVDVGSPLVVAAQTRADLLKDIGFIFERGETEASRLRSGADIERRTGEAARRQSRWRAFATLGQGLGSLGLQLDNS
jgi:hypothetical protein